MLVSVAKGKMDLPPTWRSRKSRAVLAGKQSRSAMTADTEEIWAPPGSATDNVEGSGANDLIKTGTL